MDESAGQDDEEPAFFGRLSRGIGRLARKAAPVLGRIARVAAPIAAAVGVTAAASAVIRRRRGGT